MAKTTAAAKKRRSTIGSNPLDAVVPDVKAASRASRRGLATAGTAARTEEPPVPKKVRATFHLPADLLDELRSAVVALSGPPDRLTLASLAENALRRELERLKKSKNKGKPFPHFAGKLVGGRPIGS